MRLLDIQSNLHPDLYQALCNKGIDELRPAQVKAIDAGLFDNRSLLVCTPTASGKTLIAEMAMANAILNGIGKAIYIVPLRALAAEKANEFSEKYKGLFRTTLSIGDLDSDDGSFMKGDLVITTSEKLDSLIRHSVSWLRDVGVIIIDEIHLLNDVGRGPTLEVLITILRRLLPKTQFISLSATIGNEKELADWLGAKLVHDTWRPVVLKKGTLAENTLEFFKRIPEEKDDTPK
jgi:helicase